LNNLSLSFPDRILCTISALGINLIIFIHIINIFPTIDAAWFIVTSIVQLFYVIFAVMVFNVDLKPMRKKYII
jgi:hypothetical protein